MTEKNHSSEIKDEVSSFVREDLTTGKGFESSTAPTSELASLPSELGFIETYELAAIKQRILAAFAAGDTELQVPHLSDLYQATGQEELEKIEGSDTEQFTKGRIGFIVAQANIYYQAGQFGLYRSQLNDALTYADNMHYDDVATRIKTALDNIPKTEEDQMTSEVTSSELALALADELPEETCLAISEMDLADGLGTAFEELINVGVEDPEAYLKDKGILE